MLRTLFKTVCSIAAALLCTAMLVEASAARPVTDAAAPARIA